MDNNQDEKKTVVKNPKKKAMRGFLITTIVLLVIIVVSFILLAPLGFLLLAVSVWLWPGEFMRIRRVYCNQCGNAFDWQRDVSCQTQNQVQSAKKVTATVEFECRCHHCGAEKTFRKVFTIARYSEQDHSWRKENLSALCRRYFEKKKK